MPLDDPNLIRADNKPGRELMDIVWTSAQLPSSELMAMFEKKSAVASRTRGLNTMTGGARALVREGAPVDASATVMPPAIADCAFYTPTINDKGWMITIELKHEPKP
jgi:hypothetical protein